MLNKCQNKKCKEFNQNEDNNCDLWKQIKQGCYSNEITKSGKLYNIEEQNILMKKLLNKIYDSLENDNQLVDKIIDLHYKIGGILK